VRGSVGIITLNRPKALNALSPTLVRELVDSALSMDADTSIGAIIVTGAGDKAFAAGADIKEMSALSYMDMYKRKLFGELDSLTTVRRMNRDVASVWPGVSAVLQASCAVVACWNRWVRVSRCHLPLKLHLPSKYPGAQAYNRCGQRLRSGWRV